MNGPNEGSVRILLVEDESLIAEDIKSVLKQLGYSVLPAVSSGEEAVRQAEELKPDLILMDIILSGEMDGVTATEIIRSRSDIPIIYLTAHADEGTLERAKKTEPYGYILKPFHDQELKSVIDTAMYKHGMEKKLKESEEKYRNLVERANDGIVIVQDGIVKYINPRLAEMWNSSVEEIIGTPFIDHLSPDERPTLVERYKQRMAGEDVPPVYEAVLRRKDGSIVYSELNAGVIVYQGKPADLVMVRDITERKKADDKIKASLEEKNVMLKEIHHRVRNNLQVIKSLLSLQSRYVKDTQALEMFKESQERIQSMAMVHEKLYESEDFARIDFVDYVASLARGLYRARKVDPERIALKIKAAKAIPLGIDLAVPCGIVVNELVTNALKHAFPPPWKKKGLIQISLKSVGEDEVEVVVKDNGTGLPEGVDFHDADTLGFRLVKILVEDQLRGKLSVEQVAGTKVQIRFQKV